MKTSILFYRMDDMTPSDLVTATFTCAETVDPVILMSKFKKAVTQWAQTTDTGKEAYEDSYEDFNIGDFSHNEEDDELKRCLSEEGISVEIAHISTHACHSFDSLLVEPSFTD